MNLTGGAAKSFRDVFVMAPAATAMVPGRVNLIGEHIDYTGGTVLPTVLPCQLKLSMAPRVDDQVAIYSSRFDSLISDWIDRPNDGHWTDYVFAGHRKLLKEGVLQGGASYHIDSDIPHGAGVSSSAALLVAIMKAGGELAGQNIDPVAAARWAQAVETDDIGVPCGIMDQMAVAVGRPGYALALDTVDQTYALVPLLEGSSFLIYHSGVTRALADGQYKERFDMVARAADMLGVQHLSRVREAEAGDVLSRGGTLAKRTRHVITEHQRVLEAIAALKDNDAKTFGTLMVESEHSMRDDFEIVPEAMHQMVMVAVECGAWGARLTGGGFGGCWVACIPNEQVHHVCQEIEQRFPTVRLIAKVG